VAMCKGVCVGSRVCVQERQGDRERGESDGIMKGTELRCSQERTREQEEKER
jgi:hypothetical protein